MVEHWDPDNVVGLVRALSKILFVYPRMFRRHEIKNQRHILAECGSYKECADTVNAIFYGTAMDAAYLLAAKPTRHFHRWCTNIAERSEELLVSMGYPILPLERPSAILQDYTSRIAPPTWQLLEYLKSKIPIDTRNNDENVLAQNVIVFGLKKKITDTHLMIPEILKSIHVLRLAGRALPNEISIQAKNLSFSKSIQKALFFNICSAYFHVYRVAPVMTDRNRRPFGHATGWAKLVLKLGTCRLARAIRLGRLNEARGNPWLDHLSSGLADAAQLKRHTIARRLEQAWRDVQAADRGDPGLLPIRAAGFLTRSSQDCAN